MTKKSNFSITSPILSSATAVPSSVPATADAAGSGLPVYDSDLLKFFMDRCVELALRGAGYTAPNPLVGCVIAHGDRIIGEGFHARFGGPHAEVAALSSVTERHLLPESTLFVNLEPCNHYGKTPPCTSLLIESGIRRVVVGCLDPNPIVAGKGIARLRDAGIETVVGIQEDLCRSLNRRFFCFHTAKRPYVLLKWAETMDGFVARTDFRSKWISNERSRVLVHQWRSEEAGILVGTDTAWYDNPSLTVRNFDGPNPIRIVVDRRLRLPHTLHVFDGTVRTLLFSESLPSEDLLSVTESFVTNPDSDFLDQVLQSLHERGVLSIFVEGGGKLLQSLLDRGLWDEARVFTGQVCFGTGIHAPKMRTGPVEEFDVAGDSLKVYFRERRFWSPALFKGYGLDEAEGTTPSGGSELRPW